MRPLSVPLLLCKLAILLVSLEGIVCPVLMDFVVKNFSSVDVYSHVVVQGDNRTGRLFLRKSAFDFADGGHQPSGPQYVLPLRNIKRRTLKQEGNCPKIVSFSVHGVAGDYNIRFKTEKQACHFINSKALHLPSNVFIRWLRIYKHSRPVIIAYDVFDTGDIGFKLLDNEDYTNEYERLSQLPYVFMRSDIKNEMKTRSPHTLYLRNRTRVEDYEIKFQSEENLDTFLEFFPDRIFNDYKTQSYFFVPKPFDTNTSESRNTSESHDPLETHDTNTSETRDTSELHDSLKSLDINAPESRDTSE